MPGSPLTTATATGWDPAFVTHSEEFRDGHEEGRDSAKKLAMLAAYGAGAKRQARPRESVSSPSATLSSITPSWTAQLSDLHSSSQVPPSTKLAGEGIEQAANILGRKQDGELYAVSAGYRPPQRHYSDLTYNSSDQVFSTVTAVEAREPELCEEQITAKDIVLSGKNVFITGSAGCGKSTLTKSLLKALLIRGKHVYNIAPTGRVALDMSGTTTWSYAGWTPDSMKSPLEVLKKNCHELKVWQRLRDTDILIIDEISMVENHFFERLNAIMKEARGDNNRAFGGVQLVVTGDFCQLPPVKPFEHCITCGAENRTANAGNSWTCPRNHGSYCAADKWAFLSQAWDDCHFQHINLTTIHRQSDATFIEILQKIRYGRRLTLAESTLLKNHASETENATEIYPRITDVRRVNDSKFRAIHSPARSYNCHDHFEHRPHHPQHEIKKRRAADGTLLALRDHRYEPFLQLKEGMLVVLLANTDQDAGLVNGSQGRIVRFEPITPDNTPSRKNKQSPLSGPHAHLQEYRLQDFVQQHSESAEWPVVRFNNGIERMVCADCTVNLYGDDEPYSRLCRTQIPLMAGYAMSVHRSQGMTLDRVIVDLAKAFEAGMTYVALTRTRSLNGLKVISLGERDIPTDPQVQRFLRDKLGITV